MDPFLLESDIHHYYKFYLLLVNLYIILETDIERFNSIAAQRHSCRNMLDQDKRRR